MATMLLWLSMQWCPQTITNSLAMEFRDGWLTLPVFFDWSLYELYRKVNKSWSFWNRKKKGEGLEHGGRQNMPQGRDKKVECVPGTSQCSILCHLELILGGHYLTKQSSMAANVGCRGAAHSTCDSSNATSNTSHADRQSPRNYHSRPHICRRLPSRCFVTNKVTA